MEKLKSFFQRKNPKISKPKKESSKTTGKIVNQFRIETTNQGTISIVVVDETFKFYFIELPWRDNKSNISCIPAGTYQCDIRKSRKYGKTYHVKNVPGRTYILQHGGNFAGDRTKGYKYHSCGCQLFGRKVGHIRKQRATINSKITMRKFMSYMKYEPYQLIIHNKCKGLGD